jgi:hypothetical protein
MRGFASTLSRLKRVDPNPRPSAFRGCCLQLTPLLAGDATMTFVSAYDVVNLPLAVLTALWGAKAARKAALGRPRGPKRKPRYPCTLYL